MKRLKEIDILKGIGIFCVLIGHSIPDANTQISNYFWGGYLGGYILFICRYLLQYLDFYILIVFVDVMLEVRLYWN